MKKLLILISSSVLLISCGAGGSSSGGGSSSSLQCSDVRGLWKGNLTNANNVSLNISGGDMSSIKFTSEGGSSEYGFDKFQCNSNNGVVNISLTSKYVDTTLVANLKSKNELNVQSLTGSYVLKSISGTLNK